jgi:hypothetical protein
MKQNTPTTVVLNVKALPSDVLQCYQSHQDITTTLGINDLTLFQDTKTGLPTHKYHKDPFSSGKHVILLTGAVLEENCDTKCFFRNPPVCHDSTPKSVRLWYRFLTACRIYVQDHEVLTKGYDPVGFKFDYVGCKLEHNYKEYWVKFTQPVLLQS